MTSPPLRVIKLGGSLLDWPEWVGQFRRWLARQPPAPGVIITGGGEFVQRIRALDRAHSLPAETSHWLAVRAMSLTAAITAELLSEAALVHSLDELKRTSVAAPLILDVQTFLREQHSAPDAVSCSWDVTSDSIAARVAAVLRARELVLLKSALPRGDASLRAWVADGFVDAHFARSAHGLAVRSVNLRDPDFSEVVARCDP